MNLQEMMRQAQRLKNKIEKIQEEIGEQTIEGTSGGGMVVVVANGKGQIVSCRIEKQVVNPEDVEMLQDLIVAATNQAVTRAKEMMDGEIAKATGGQGGLMSGLV